MGHIAHFVSQSLKDSGDVALGGRTKTLVPTDDRPHLDAAVWWLQESIRVHGSEGSAHSYRIAKGWMPPYPETTGYILKTFLRLADVRDRERNEAIARQLADWLISVQMPNGGIAGYYLGKTSQPVVFNTGMVLLGFNAIFARSRDTRYLDAARRAGDFLLGCLDDDGCFSRYNSHNLVHTYNARTAWALLELGRISGETRYYEAGRRNLDWVLRQQAENGYFRNNAFKPGGNANSHGTSYVLEGLLQSHLLTADPAYLSAARRTIDRVVELYRERKWIAAELGPDWEYRSRHICLTGCCQMAIVLMTLYRIEPRPAYWEVANQLLEQMKRLQNVRDRGKPYYGAIKGSHPIYGRYARLQYPNWATKFFIDALLLKAAVARDEAASPAEAVPALAGA